MRHLGRGAPAFRTEHSIQNLEQLPGIDSGAVLRVSDALGEDQSAVESKIVFSDRVFDLRIVVTQKDVATLTTCGLIVVGEREAKRVRRES